MDPTPKSFRVLAALSLLVLVALPSLARPSNKWRIQCSESAKSDGRIVFLISPKGGEPIKVVIEAKKGTGENAMARHIRDGLRAQLPKEEFHVEVDDGEDVLVKKKGKAPNFDLEIEENTVKSFRMNLDRE